MRFTSFIVAGALALVASAQTTSDSTASSTATSTASTVVSVDPAQSSEAACLKACKAGDVDCQSKCIAVSHIVYTLYPLKKRASRAGKGGARGTICEAS